MLRRDLLNGLDVHFRLDAGDIRLARVVGGDGGQILAVRVNFEGRPAKRHPALGVLFHDDEPNLPNVLKSERNSVLRKKRSPRGIVKVIRWMPMSLWKTRTYRKYGTPILKEASNVGILRLGIMTYRTRLCGNKIRMYCHWWNMTRIGVRNV